MTRRITDPGLEARQRIVLHHMRAYLDTVALVRHPPFVNTHTEQPMENPTPPAKPAPDRAQRIMLACYGAYLWTTTLPVRFRILRLRIEIRVRMFLADAGL